MPTEKKTINQRDNRTIIVMEKNRSHATDPYVLKKVEHAKAFIAKAGLPVLKK